MKNPNKSYLLFILAIMITAVVSGCTGQTGGPQTNSGQSPALNADEQKTSAGTSSNILSNPNDSGNHASLSIGPGCIGCNRCVRLDPEHFSINQGSQIPDVISQKNLASAPLKTAADNCPVKVIALK